MNEVRIKDAYIKLDQALKLSGACDLGSDAKYAIQGGKVSVNGEVEERRGRKLHPGAGKLQELSRRKISIFRRQ